MLTALQILATVLMALAFALAVAHALELPGKLRLSREDYLKVQSIYYPGFTIGGISEPAALLVLIALVIVTPQGSKAFWLTVGALATIAGVIAVYWIITHPTNKFWVRDMQLSSASSRFFDVRSAAEEPADWTVLRQRWEYSHVARAILAFVGLLLLTTAVAIG